MSGRGTTAAQDAVREAEGESNHADGFDFPLGALVRVNITGRVVGRSQFEEGEPSYLVEHERRGKPVREWIVADKLVAVKADAVNDGGEA